MVFTVNKQWVLHNLYRKSILNKYECSFFQTVKLFGKFATTFRPPSNRNTRFKSHTFSKVLNFQMVIHGNIQTKI